MSHTRLRLLAVLTGAVLAVLIASPAQAKPVVVHSGDTLSALVHRECGSWNWQQAARDNARTNPNPHLIYPGQVLQINCAPAASAPAVQAPASGWVAPVKACISSGFGMRWGRMHWGTDLSAGYGTAIRAAAAGTVSTGYQAGGAGYYTMIVHGGGLASVYMHQSRFAVRSGWVGAGQIIGYVGSTGNSTGAHLHFETHTAGLWHGKVNPVTFMSARGVRLGC